MGVEAAEIAGAEPPAGPEGFTVSGFVVPVALKDAGAANGNFSFFAGGQRIGLRETGC